MKLDLKDAYFVVPVYHEHQKFFQVCSQGKTYQFNCLLFSLSSAPSDSMAEAKTWLSDNCLHRQQPDYGFY